MWAARLVVAQDYRLRGFDISTDAIETLNTMGSILYERRGRVTIGTFTIKVCMYFGTYRGVPLIGLSRYGFYNSSLSMEAVDWMVNAVCLEPLILFRLSPESSIKRVHPSSKTSIHK